MGVMRGALPDWARSSGSGDGYGSGYGYGSGDDLVACQPGKHPVTADALLKGGACVDVVKKFSRAFPNGGTWPDDIDKAVAAGLDVNWCRRLGLLRPI